MPKNDIILEHRAQSTEHRAQSTEHRAQRITPLYCCAQINIELTQGDFSRKGKAAFLRRKMDVATPEF